MVADLYNQCPCIQLIFKDNRCQICDPGIAAAIMFTPEKMKEVSDTQLRVAFDGDAVLFSDESERICKAHGLDKFFEHEKAHENKPLDHVQYTQRDIFPLENDRKGHQKSNNTLISYRITPTYNSHPNSQKVGKLCKM